MVKRVYRNAHGGLMGAGNVPVRLGAASEEDDSIIVSDEPDNDTPSEVMEILAQFSGSNEYTITIHKYNDEKVRWEQVLKMPLDQFNEDDIGKKYGGGQYKYVVKEPNGKFKQQIRANYAQRLEETNGAVIVDNGQREMVTMLREELKESRSKEQNLYTGMFGMITEMMKANQAQVRPAAPAADFLDMYVKLKAIDGKNPATEMSSVIDLLKTGMSMGKDLGAASAETSPEDMVVKKLIEVAGNSLPNILALLAKSQGQPRQAAPAAPPVAPAAQPIFIPSVPAVPERETINMQYRDGLEKNVIETIRASKNELLFAATAKVDMGMVVNSILTKVNEDGLNDLYDYYSDDDALSRTLEFVPEFKVHAEWLEKILRAVLSEVGKTADAEQGKESAAPAVVVADGKKTPDMDGV